MCVRLKNEKNIIYYFISLLLFCRYSRLPCFGFSSFLVVLFFSTFNFLNSAVNTGSLGVVRFFPATPSSSSKTFEERPTSI